MYEEQIAPLVAYLSSKWDDTGGVGGGGGGRIYKILSGRPKLEQSDRLLFLVKREICCSKSFSKLSQPS